jgi:exosortase
MQDNTLRVIVSEKSEVSPDLPSKVLFFGIATVLVSVATIVFLFGLNPYASGYGADRVTIFHFAKTLWNDAKGDWTHCYLVPLAVAAMVYFRRKQLLETPISPAWSGLGITLFGFAVYWLGFRADNIYLGYASLQILTLGLILWFCGWNWLKILFFAWAFLVFLYPVPFLETNVAFKLRMVMSEASVAVLNMMGIGAIKVGTAILSAPDTLAGFEAGKRFSVDVADPCSGIRSLFALMMVSALYGYFTQPGIWRKLVMFMFSMPLAVLGNLARIVMLTIGTIAFGSEVAIGTEENPTFFHMLAGYLVFGVAIAGLLGIGTLLNTDWRKVYERFRSSWNSPPPPPRPPKAGGLPQKSAHAHAHDEY